MDKENRDKNNKFSLWCLVIWNVLIFGALLIVFGKLLQRRISGISTGVEELIFLILIPVFILVNIKKVYANIRQLCLSYLGNQENKILKDEAEKYAFIQMYRRLSIRRICLPLLIPALYILVLVVFIPIATKGVLTKEAVLMMFNQRPMQLAFLPVIVIPVFISIKVYFSSRHNLDMLREIYDSLSGKEMAKIDSIKERQVGYVFTRKFLINWDGNLNIVPLNEIREIRYIRYFYFILYGTRLKITCNKNYVIWHYGPSEEDWMERGFLPPDKISGRSVSINIQLPH
ncbi:hypothetical protein GCWU000282_01247 [Catonella morbi ATCC 51271]|uniref:Uncharacterized protein n=1 Tax=Catonella morbi ATCC 51271 TaxID=592026 RepID=V2Z9B6_9FIRM|nr:hypothetical protein [Catonella morbi]ESL03535.1 hypothetical protein GCWU000282_01247 [Catonella morbi ATCC 51271]